MYTTPVRFQSFREVGGAWQVVVCLCCQSFFSKASGAIMKLWFLCKSMCGKKLMCFACVFALLVVWLVCLCLCYILGC